MSKNEQIVFSIVIVIAVLGFGYWGSKIHCKGKRMRRALDYIALMKLCEVLPKKCRKDCFKDFQEEHEKEVKEDWCRHLP